GDFSLRVAGGKLKVQQDEHDKILPAELDVKKAKQGQYRNKHCIYHRNDLAEHERNIDIVGDAKREHHIRIAGDVAGPLTGIFNSIDYDKKLNNFKIPEFARRLFFIGLEKLGDKCVKYL